MKLETELEKLLIKYKGRRRLMERPFLTYPYMNSENNFNAHHYLIFCCDVLGSILKYADDKKLGQVTMKFVTDDDMEKFNCSDKGNHEWIDWLAANGYENHVNDMFYRHVLFSAIKDFQSFMFESVTCAGKMKMSVAYALLRRPFKDALGIIEWLAVDKDAVIQNLEAENPFDLEITRERAKELTDKVQRKYGLNPQYDLRYKNKDTSTRFELIWDKALHMITTRASPSGKGELNFLFAGEKKLAELSDWYYKVAPLVMHYAVELIVELFESIAKPNEVTVGINYLNRMAHLNLIAPILTDSLVKEVETLLFCPQCGEQNEYKNRDIASHLQCGVLSCPKCKAEVDTRFYITEYESIKAVVE